MTMKLRCPRVDSQRLGLDTARVFLLVLACFSLMLAALCLVSHFVAWPPLPSEALLSVALAKAALYTVLSLLRLLMRRMHKEERMVTEVRIDWATNTEQSYNKIVVVPKKVGPNSVKARELWSQILDDVLGLVPAALAFTGFNSRRQDTEELLGNFTDLTIIVLIAVAILFKVVRLAAEVSGTVIRARQRLLTCAGAAINALALAADGAALANYVLLLLRVADLSLAVSASPAWLLPTLHIPVVGTSDRSASDDHPWNNPSSRASGSYDNVH